MLAGDINAGYHAACAIFETLLEHGCRAGGNGHHVAQNFNAMLTTAAAAAPVEIIAAAKAASEKSPQ